MEWRMRNSGTESSSVHHREARSWHWPAGPEDGDSALVMASFHESRGITKRCLCRLIFSFLPLRCSCVTFRFGWLCIFPDEFVCPSNEDDKPAYLHPLRKKLHIRLLQTTILWLGSRG